MKKMTAIVLTLGLILPGLAVHANAESRYSFEKVGTGYLRFDKETGQIDQCASHSEGIKCVLSADDRVALEKQITELKARIAELEAGNAKTALPSKQDLDQAFDMLKYFSNKFQGMMKEEEKQQNVPPQQL